MPSGRGWHRRPWAPAGCPHAPADLRPRVGRLRPRPFLHLPPRGPPSSQRRRGVDTRPVHNLTTASTCSDERKSRASDAGSQKRAGVKLGEAGVSGPDTPRAWASGARGQPSCEREGEAVGGNGACGSSERPGRGESWLDVASAGNVGAVRAECPRGHRVPFGQSPVQGPSSPGRTSQWSPCPLWSKSSPESEGSGPSVLVATMSLSDKVWSGAGRGGFSTVSGKKPCP